jgi:hypothetical protein
MVDSQLQPKPVAAFARACAMKQLTGPAALLWMLVASTLAHSDDVTGRPNGPLDFDPASKPDSTYADFGRPDETARVTGANDIYRTKIHDPDAAASGDRPRDPIEVFGQSGYYLYDLDAWAMVSSGPIIGPYRSRSYSLFGAGLDDPALNALTMRSEYLRSNAGIDTGSRASWSYTGWHF